MNELDPWVAGLFSAARSHQRRHLHRAFTAPRRKVMWLGMRQAVGKTWTQSALAAILANGIDYCGRVIPAHDVYLISADQQRGIDMIRRVTEHLDIASIAYDPRDPKLGSTTRLAMRNGCQIRALTSDPSNLQGLTGSVLADEFSLCVDPPALVAQALSVTQSSPIYRALFTTNASGGGTYLARLLLDPDYATRRREWMIQTTTVNDVFPDGLPPDLESIRDALDPESWRRYYLCEFVGVDLPVLAPHLRDRCADDSRAQHHHPRHGERWISVDVGMGRHATAVLELSRVGAHVQVDHVHLFWESDTVDQVGRIARIARHIGARAVHIDAGGVGRGVADGLAAEGLGVTYCATSDTTRSAGADAIRSLAERDLISWAHAGGDVAELRRDFGSAERIEGADAKTKSVRLPERKAESGRVTHCDALDALLQTMAITKLHTSAGITIGAPIRRLAL